MIASLTVAACGATPPTLPSLDTEIGSSSVTGGEAQTGETGDDAPPDSAESGPVSSTTGGPAGTSTSAAGPVLVFDDELFDFGSAALDAPQSAGLMLRNEGDEATVGLMVAIEGDGFSTGRNRSPLACREVLGAGDHCVIAVDFVAGELGPATGTVRAAADNAAEAELSLVAAGAGLSEELLANPDAEMTGSPPPGWMAVVSEWSATTQFAYTGRRSFSPVGLGFVSDAILEQVVDLTGFANAVSGGLATVEFFGAQRASNGGNDPGTMEIVALDASGTELDAVASRPTAPATWQVWEPTLALPRATAMLRVRLTCIGGGFSCNAFFDGLSLRLRYD